MNFGNLLIVFSKLCLVTFQAYIGPSVCEWSSPMITNIHFDKWNLAFWKIIKL